MNKFFDEVSPLFNGNLSNLQKDGLSRIVNYGRANGVNRVHLGYMLGTVYHETARWMQPIREGATRSGPAYTDAQSKAAVTAIYNKGIIRTNYALPAGPFKQSYYGRGLVQITWYENYRKFGDLLDIPLAQKPDMALEWDVALKIMHYGMRDGLFTGKSLKSINNPCGYVLARSIINGDGKKYGNIIAGYASGFYNALEGIME